MLDFLSVSGRASVLVSALVLGAVPATTAAARPPDILLVSVDTLRADHLSSYGYFRNTSPVIDALLAGGARFSNARTVEPLTAPALASMLTSLHPHEHGCTRNGLGVRRNLTSFSRILGRRGYETAAFVGNWTLRAELSGLDEHFETYESVLTKKRWFGLAKREATADDVSALALEWLSGHLESDPRRPFLLWVHYVEPHAPYRMRKDYLGQLGLKAGGSVFSPKKRYDSEIAFVDDRIGQLLEAVEEMAPGGERVTVFVSDHGESLGHHGYWGHGRHLYEASLWIPMGIAWPGRIDSSEVSEPATILDLAPTLLGLAGLPGPRHFRGFDWTPVLVDGQPADPDRVTYFQAHKSAVEPKEDNTRLRRKGLLEVARVGANRKEMFRVVNSRRRLFDLEGDRAEKSSRVRLESVTSDDLTAWLEEVREGLEVADDLPPPSLTDEDLKALRALGYID